MRWPKYLLAVLFAILILALAAVYLTPLDTYIPRVEQALSRQLHEPVRVQHIRLAALPLPHLELNGVRLGQKEDIAIQSINVEPDLPALLTGNMVVRRILIQDGSASLAYLRKLAGLFGKAPPAEPGVAVRELQLSGMKLLMPGRILGPIEGKLELGQAGQLKRAWFAMDEQKVTAVLLPLPEQHFSVKMQAHAWSPPELSQLLLDELQIEGILGSQDIVAQKFAVALHGIRASGSGKLEFSDGWRVTATLGQVEAPLERIMALLGKPADLLAGEVSVKGVLDGKAATLSGLKDNLGFSGEILINHAKTRIAADILHPLILDQIRAHVVIQPERIELSALEARLYGGKLSGAASLNRKNTVLDAEITASEIAMQSLVEALTNDVLFTGSMKGKTKLSMRMDAFEQFPGNMLLSGNFHLHNGTLTKVDLAQAVNNPDKAGTKGGVTRFDDLTGLIAVDASGYHFSKLKIISGSLDAEGKVDVSPSLQLSGKLDARVKGTVGLVSMPMVVSGTLDAPIIRVSKAAWAGAAVGTAILGPGLGTALGMRIGGFMSKLFGKDDNQNDGKDNTYDLPGKAPAAPPVKK